MLLDDVFALLFSVLVSAVCFIYTFFYENYLITVLDALHCIAYCYLIKTHMVSKANRQADI